MNAVKSFWGNAPLSSKLSALASLLILVVVLLLSVISIQREQINFRTEWEERADLLLNTLPFTIRDELYRLEIDELRDVAKVVNNNPNINQVVIYDLNGSILVDTSQSNLLFTSAIDELGEKLISQNSDDVIFSWKPEELVASKAVRLGNQSIGAITISLSNQPLEEKISSITQQSILLGVLSLVFGLILSYIVGRELANPLQNLVNISNEMAKGKHSLKVDTQFNDEIGKLGAAFNHMSLAIEERETELRNLAMTLEHTVEERTAQLGQTNENLRVEIELRKKSEEALVKARNEALDASRLKTQLIANVSHDLRTPINVILGYGEMLESGAYGELSEKASGMLIEIISSAGQLLNFVNNLLDQAQIESGKLKINNRPFHPSNLLDNATLVTGVLARNKGLDLQKIIEDDVAETIIGDSHWLYQILFNLINNSIKFTDTGSIITRIYNADKNHWGIEVTDTGIGIPKEAQLKIYESFWQVDGTATRGQTTGTGLGLSIVKQLVELMNGEITLESDLGKGSTFKLIFPILAEESSPNKESI